MERINILVGQLRKDDEAAFDQIYTLFSEKVFHVAFAILRSQEEAYEVVQETFLVQLHTQFLHTAYASCLFSRL